MLVYYFVPFIVSNRYLLFWVSNGHNSVTVRNRTHVYMNSFHHKDLGNHLLQLCPKVVKHPVYGEGIFKLMPRYDKCKNVYAKKLWNFNKINEVALEQKSISDEYVEMRWLLQVYINCNCNSHSSMH